MDNSFGDRVRRWLLRDVTKELKKIRKAMPAAAPLAGPASWHHSPPAPQKKKAEGMTMEPYSTHQSLLVAAMAHTTGDIIEVGGGWYSTPLVASFSHAGKRLAYTIETGDYVFNILKQFDSSYHRIRKIDGYHFDQVGKFTGDASTDKSQYIARQAVFLEELWNEYLGRKDSRSARLSVAFVDQAPGFLRVPAIQFFADKADYVITHDTEHVEHYGYEPTFSSFKSRWDFTLHQPNAVILSNFHDCSHFNFLQPPRP